MSGKGLFYTFVLLLGSLFFSSCGGGSSRALCTDVLVVGGGASGVSSGVTAARMGAETVVIEESTWLGGMLTSAGVSGIDGNFSLPSGFFGEFRDSLVSHYGSLEALNTGWVSRVLFEPSVGNDIFQRMVANEANLRVHFESRLSDLKRVEGKWYATVQTPEGEIVFNPKVVIDATELGDVAKLVGVPYDIGMDSRHDTEEMMAPEEANGIIQDLTYVMVLKDYGYDVSLEQPEGYDPSYFLCCCENPLCVTPKEEHRMWSKEMMITYGKLPNDKYMINWPLEGNDYYLNVIENTPAEREELLQQAKNFSLCFLYFMQTELGFSTFGLADDEFPTEDGLPLIPYHRESRRIHGAVQFTVNHITAPYEQEQKLYRTAIGVGDYPVDHHHARYSDWEALPNLYFHPVPSYGLPLGVMIPREVEGLIVAEKSISVTNIVNGTTRLQPVVLQLGQAAGALAALAVERGMRVMDVSVRDVQEALLAQGSYLLPFLDVTRESPLFLPLQRVGVTGILQGEGRNEGWANQTWFRAEEPLYWHELQGIMDLYPEAILPEGEEPVQLAEFLLFLAEVSGYEGDMKEKAREVYDDFALTTIDHTGALTRAEAAVLLDQILDPFQKEVGITGAYKHQ